MALTCTLGLHHQKCGGRGRVVCDGVERRRKAGTADVNVTTHGRGDAVMLVLVVAAECAVAAQGTARAAPLGSVPAVAADERGVRNTHWSSQAELAGIGRFVVWSGNARLFEECRSSL
jgi:hypothetical protein